MRKYPTFLFAFSLLFVAGASAQLNDLRLPISLDADSRGVTVGEGCTNFYFSNGVIRVSAPSSVGIGGAGWETSVTLQDALLGTTEDVDEFTGITMTFGSIALHSSEIVSSAIDGLAIRSFDGSLSVSDSLIVMAGGDGIQATFGGVSDSQIVADRGWLLSVPARASRLSMRSRMLRVCSATLAPAASTATWPAVYTVLP